MAAGSPFIVEFKRQASFFIKEKIKTTRLALTDVTPAQLLTEEATSEDVWPPDTRSMGEISKAAFQVDDYWRIVEIVHHRLIHYDEGSWRVSYKTLLLLEHLLTHGPLRVAQEFERRRPVIRKMGSSFAFYKEKGFNWGLSVRNLSRRVVKLIEDGQFLIEERNRRLKLTRGIQGFGNFNNEEPSTSSSSSSDSDDNSLTLFSTGTQSPDSTGGFTLTETNFNSNYECSENQIHSYLQLPMEDDEIEDSLIECHHLVFSSDNSTTISLSSP